jgi:hypothetical protein
MGARRPSGITSRSNRSIIVVLPFSLPDVVMLLVSKVGQSSSQFQLPNVSLQVPAAELLHNWQGNLPDIHVDRKSRKTRKYLSSLANSEWP